VRRTPAVQVQHRWVGPSRPLSHPAAHRRRNTATNSYKQRRSHGGVRRVRASRNANTCTWTIGRPYQEGAETGERPRRFRDNATARSGRLPHDGRRLGRVGGVVLASSRQEQAAHPRSPWPEPLEPIQISRSAVLGRTRRGTAGRSLVPAFVPAARLTVSHIVPSPSPTCRICSAFLCGRCWD
jgi:hypothetical protein